MCVCFARLRNQSCLIVATNDNALNFLVEVNNDLKAKELTYNGNVLVHKERPKLNDDCTTRYTKKKKDGKEKKKQRKNL